MAAAGVIETARLVLRPFRDLGLEEIAGVVEWTNAASVRVLEKAGLLYRGEARYHDIPVLHYAAERAAWLRDHG